MDNTILDATASHLHYFNLASGLSKKPEDVHDFYMYRLYGWSWEERDAVFQKYGEDIFWNSSPYPDAIEVLAHLYDQHTISFITARTEPFRGITLKWLDHHKINYHHIVLVENKLEACQKLEVDLLIDDAPHYAEEFAASSKPYLLYDQPYNRHVNHELVYRAASWLEIKKHIENHESVLAHGRTTPT